MIIREKTRLYDETDSLASFLLGGIGTGTISIDTRGRLHDFEIYNRPNKGFTPPYTFFALNTAAVDADGKRIADTNRTQIMEAEFQPPYEHSHGYNAWEFRGAPRFRHSEFSVRYPFAKMELFDDSLPLQVQLEAFTPFIPTDAHRSGMPLAVFNWSVTNTGSETREVSVAASMTNSCHHLFDDLFGKSIFGPSSNHLFESDRMLAVHMTRDGSTAADLDHMELGLVLDRSRQQAALSESFARVYWSEGQWWDGMQDFWNDFSEDGKLDAEGSVPQDEFSIHTSPNKVSSVGERFTLAAGETAEWRFVISWYKPNRIHSWNQLMSAEEVAARPPERRSIRNYYAKWGNPMESAAYMLEHYDELEGLSRSFADAFYGSTIPEPVIDAVMSTVTVIRSNTCFRVEDGRFFGFEGCFNKAGCCDGNCSHVWNYAQSLAYLFPELERSVRRAELLEEMDEDGGMKFRAYRYLEGDSFGLVPATDGQLGTIVRVYREWQLSGDEAFLRELWPAVKRSLSYAAKVWDSDGDGMLDSQQHNTYDIDFHGPNTMTNTIYYAALEAAARMADYLGDAIAGDYRDLAARGSAVTDTACFNGEYYEQILDDVDRYKYQYGKGVLSDQLLGQTWASLFDLGYVLPEAHVKSAVKSIYDHNFIDGSGMRQLTNLQRTYALNDEAGLALCTWPRGGRPRIPFVYSDEVWSGIEYQVATLLVEEGYIDEALDIVTAVRARHDGKRRSPWNEVECGHHYARSLASYGVYAALAGYRPKLAEGTISFDPKINADDFSCFFACEKGWGIYWQKRDIESGEVDYGIETLYGDLSEISIQH